MDILKYKESLVFQLVPLFLVLVIFFFTQNEYAVTAGILVLLTATFAIKYYSDEWKVLLLGIILGFTFEIAGDLIYQAQFWENASLFGIPIWLPLMWGYGFIFIRRIGNILTKTKS